MNIPEFLGEYCCKQLEAVNYYHKALHLGCSSSPRPASATPRKLDAKLIDASEFFLPPSTGDKNFYRNSNYSIHLSFAQLVMSLD